MFPGSFVDEIVLLDESLRCIVDRQLHTRTSARTQYRRISTFHEPSIARGGDYLLEGVHDACVVVLCADRKYRAIGLHPRLDEKERRSKYTAHDTTESTG